MPDVFLTPIKPREKVVSAQDIESCLYYIHAHGPDDERILSSGEDEEDEAAPPPLPLRPRPNGFDSLPGALQSGYQIGSSHPLPSVPVIPPYPLDDGPPPIMDYSPRGLSSSTVPRKPAPAMPQRRPIGQQLSDYTEGLRSPPPHTMPLQSPRSFLAENTMAPSEHSPMFTLIRRNPASGEQWNVASIADPPVFEISSDGRRPSMTGSRIRKSGQPLYLSVTNPGYAKFIQSNQSSYPGSPVSSTPSLTYSNTTTSSQIESTFTRRMWLEGSLFEKKASNHRKSYSADVSDPPYPPPRPPIDSRRNSEFSLHASTDSNIPWDHNMQRLSIESEQKRSHTRGYTFLSPWDGRCEFSSGTMGNSLKCRHLRSKNSLAPEANAPTSVSELRFNLPGGGPLATEPQARTSPPREKESRRARFKAKFSEHRQFLDERPLHTRQSSEYIDGEKLDLSLGQELAGGGFAGKQTKLGKLIIEGEGLMMMDLLVAANMGLWFRAYEKTT